MKKEEKLALWSGRIHAFQASGNLVKHGALKTKFLRLQWDSGCVDYLLTIRVIFFRKKL